MLPNAMKPLSIRLSPGTLDKCEKVFQLKEGTQETQKQSKQNVINSPLRQDTALAGKITPSTSSTSFPSLGRLDVQLFPSSLRFSWPLFLRFLLLQYNQRMPLFSCSSKSQVNMPGEYILCSSFLIWYKENVPWAHSAGVSAPTRPLFCYGSSLSCLCQAGGLSTKKCIISKQPKRQSHYLGIHIPAREIPSPKVAW